MEKGADGRLPRTQKRGWRERAEPHVRVCVRRRSGAGAVLQHAAGNKIDPIKDTDVKSKTPTGEPVGVLE